MLLQLFKMIYLTLKKRGNFCYPLIIDLVPKYTTYFKANTKKIKKVTKAKYNNEGKLKKLSEVKSTSFTKKYYYIK